MNSFDLLCLLKKGGYFDESFETLLKTDTFEVVVSAILTQQTKWENVVVALNNLRYNNLLNLEKFANLDEASLSFLIQKCGFLNVKSHRLLNLAKSILDDFADIKNFKESVSRKWLLSQKGLGFESCDYILCYACKKPVMVVDSYTAKLLSFYGYEFGSYDELQNWFYDGIYSSWEKVEKLYEKNLDENFFWARYHGKVVDFCKKNIKGKKLIGNLPNF
jgi:endonuclease-3 related protein